MLKEPFYKERKFGDNIDVTFAFIRENFKTIIRHILLYSLPFCIIMIGLYIYNVITYQQHHFGMPTLFIYSYIPQTITKTIYITSLFINLLLIMPMALSMLDINYNRKNGLKDIRIKDTGKSIRCNIRKAMAMPFSILAFAATIALTILTLRTDGDFFLHALLSYFVLLFLSGSLTAYCLEKKSYSQSISNSLKNGIKRLGGLIIYSLLLFIISLLIFVWEFFMFELITEFGVQLIGTGFSQNTLANILFITLLSSIWIVIVFSFNIAVFMTTVGMAFHYGTMQEKNEHITLKEKIQNFDNLKES
jgi:hypothetical protein